ncbi:M67 family metallopeptidase [Iodidimonas sp. SYSU 1G8]|uniref:M67 family metallopeptidase n=1 Tax=Iodidimonas sp. SYSU 1G8 TaxID=3133967 RepID=UPI0031FE4682
MIRLAPALIERIRAAAAAAYPHECCGLLIGGWIGDVLTVDAVEASANLSPSPQDSFEIDLRLRLRLQKELRGTGREIVGHYHSHPDAPAAPSERDRAQAWEPEMIWLIAGVTAEGAGEVNAFRLNQAAGRFDPVPISMLA